MGKKIKKELQKRNWSGEVINGHCHVPLFPYSSEGGGRPRIGTLEPYDSLFLYHLSWKVLWFLGPEGFQQLQTNR